jgi:hypothetical protein
MQFKKFPDALIVYHFYNSILIFATDEWTKLNSQPVCFYAKGNRPGSFVPLRQGFLTAVKLVHLSGYVTCAASTHKHDSNWGCKDRASVVDAPLNVFVTDKNNKVQFPQVGVT